MILIFSYIHVWVDFDFTSLIRTIGISMFFWSRTQLFPLISWKRLLCRYVLARATAHMHVPREPVSSISLLFYHAVVRARFHPRLVDNFLWIKLKIANSVRLPFSLWRFSLFCSKLNTKETAWNLLCEFSNRPCYLMFICKMHSAITNEKYDHFVF